MPITRTVDPVKDPVGLPEILDHCGITDPEDNDRVLDSRASQDGLTIRRRRECLRPVVAAAPSREP